MWTFQTEKLPSIRGLRFSLFRDAHPVTFSDVIKAWQADASFRSLFNAHLADSPYRAFRWETPAVTIPGALRGFEFVLIDSPNLDRQPDPLAFAEHFAKVDSDVSVCANLGKDALMVVPAPRAESAAYGHLAAFARSAPESQRHSLWKAVGDTMAKRINEKPVWLNTAGAGVSWLHVRLDDRPKYYQFAPYRQLGDG